MKASREKYVEARRLKRLQAALNRVLYQQWRPLNQKGEAPEDEYEAYAPGLLGLLMRGAGDEAVAEHLASLEVGPLGLQPASSPAERLSIARPRRQVLAEHTPGEA